MSNKLEEKLKKEEDITIDISKAEEKEEINISKSQDSFYTNDGIQKDVKNIKNEILLFTILPFVIIAISSILFYVGIYKISYYKIYSDTLIIITCITTTFISIAVVFMTYKKLYNMTNKNKRSSKYLKLSLVYFVVSLALIGISFYLVKIEKGNFKKEANFILAKLQEDYNGDLNEIIKSKISKNDYEKSYDTILTYVDYLNEMKNYKKIYRLNIENIDIGSILAKDVFVSLDDVLLSREKIMETIEFINDYKLTLKSIHTNKLNKIDKINSPVFLKKNTRDIFRLLEREVVSDQIVFLDKELEILKLSDNILEIFDENQHKYYDNNGVLIDLYEPEVARVYQIRFDELTRSIESEEELVKLNKEKYKNRIEKIKSIL